MPIILQFGQILELLLEEVPCKMGQCACNSITGLCKICKSGICCLQNPRRPKDVGTFFMLWVLR